MNEELIARITNYLSSGGLWNPEAMEHNKVTHLLLDCRSALSAATQPSQYDCIKCGRPAHAPFSCEAAASPAALSAVGEPKGMDSEDRAALIDRLQQALNNNGTIHELSLSARAALFHRCLVAISEQQDRRAVGETVAWEYKYENDPPGRRIAVHVDELPNSMHKSWQRTRPLYAHPESAVDYRKALEKIAGGWIPSDFNIDKVGFHERFANWMQKVANAALAAQAPQVEKK